MIIRGNIAGNLSPRADWSQADPTKADFIRGKETVTAAIAAAQAEAQTHAQSKANPHGVTPAQIGAAAADHSHSAADVGSLTAAQILAMIQTELGVIENGTY